MKIEFPLPPFPLVLSKIELLYSKRQFDVILKKDFWKVMGYSETHQGQAHNVTAAAESYGLITSEYTEEGKGYKVSKLAERIVTGISFHDDCAKALLEAAYNPPVFRQIQAHLGDRTIFNDKLLIEHLQKIFTLSPNKLRDLAKSYNSMLNHLNNRIHGRAFRKIIEYVTAANKQYSFFYPENDDPREICRILRKLLETFNDEQPTETKQ